MLMNLAIATCIYANIIILVLLQKYFISHLTISFADFFPLGILYIATLLASFVCKNIATITTLHIYVMYGLFIDVHITLHNIKPYVCHK